MTDIDPIAREQFERIFPSPTACPDWRGVLARRRRRRSLFTVAPASVAVAAVALILLVLAPWRGSTPFIGEALAAVGGGRWVTAVVESAQPYTYIVETHTGRTRPAMVRNVLVYDRSRQRELSWQVTAGKPLRFSSSQTGPQPQLAHFVGGYLQALRSGSARVVGSATFHGHTAELVSFKVGAAGSEVVAVDRRTHMPLWFRQVIRNHVAPILRVVLISSSAREPRLPDALPASAYLTWHASPLREVDITEASRALGHRAIWAGRRVKAVSLTSVALERVVRIRVNGLKPLAATLGLRLLYSGANGASIEVDEETQPFGFDFVVYPGFSALAGNISVPGPDRLVLSCNACGAGSHVPSYRPLWTAQLHRGGLYIRVQSFDRKLVLLTAKSLRSTP